MTHNGDIIEKRPYPSPNPAIRLTEITYLSQGLRIKGLLAEPKTEGTYDGFLYLRGGMQSIGMVRPSRIAQFAAQGFIVFAPYYRGNRGGEGRDEFAGADRYDAVYAVDVLKQFCNDNIHVFGFSRGGIMALWTAILRRDITSIVTWAGVSDPVLIIHGYRDENVDIEHARQLAFFLEEANKSFETWYDLNYAHQYPPAKNRETVRALCKWMKQQ